MHLREFGIDDVPDITVVGCPVAGLTPSELLDASAVAREFTEMFVGNREYTNLPRKFNVAITGCLDNCIHTLNQDVALTPAVREVDGSEVPGFNVAAGGKMGSGGYTPNTPLDLFVTREEAAEICGHITLAFRDHGSREARNKTRLVFLIAEWGAERFRADIENRDRLLPLVPDRNQGALDRNGPSFGTERGPAGENLAVLVRMRQRLRQPCAGRHWSGG